MILIPRRSYKCVCVTPLERWRGPTAASRRAGIGGRRKTACLPADPFVASPPPRLASSKLCGHSPRSRRGGGGPWEVSSRGERGNNAESRFRSPRCRVLVFALVDAEASQREAPLRKVGSQACRKICSKKAMFVSIWPSKMHLTRRNLEEKQSQRRRRRVLTLRPHQLMMTKQTVTGTRRMTRYL